MTQCGKFKCQTDTITYDDMEPDDKCVSFKNDDACAKCETVNSIRASDARGFNLNPIKKMFDQDATEAEIDSFWQELELCGISRPAPEVEARFYVAEPDYAVLDKNARILLKRIDPASTAAQFIQTLHEIAQMPKKNMASKSDMQRQVKDLLVTRKCHSQMVHDTTELPMGIYLLFADLVKTTKNKFFKVVDYINERHQICLEAYIEKCHQILSERGTKKKRKRNTRRKHARINVQKQERKTPSQQAEEK